ncbi:MAG: deoxyribose-phosphate aldolase [Bdellovibrio sp.]|jgi:deoxyribose-phosphate aldolase
MQLASYIDHTLLKPEASKEQIVKTCKEALEHKFFGVCVNSVWMPTVVAELKGSAVASVAVVGFPLGAMSSRTKAFEAEWCVNQGADEIDMVLNIGALKEKNFAAVKADIAEVAKACGMAKLKVILEIGLLNSEEKRAACDLAVNAGAHFVKTCTGFNIGNATVEDILLMRAAVGPDFGVKASGGIKTQAHALLLLEAGATRLGTSAGVQLVQNEKTAGGY